MRVMLVMLVAVGCGDQVSTPTPVDDGLPELGAADGCQRLDEYGPNVSCFPIGAQCDLVPKQFCARGLGWCLDLRCREICGETTPRCPAGEVEHHSRDEVGDLCVCVPGCVPG